MMSEYKVLQNILPIMTMIVMVMIPVGNFLLYQQINPAPLPTDAAAGYVVWQRVRCESCHTFFGHGGNYAPDLTKIYAQRGAEYLREFMVNPAAFHPGQRVMPRFNLTRTEVDQLIALLRWSAEDAPFRDWSPNVLNVSGRGAGAFVGGSSVAAPESPVALGQQIYGQRCASCHSLEADVVIIGPSFYGVAERAATRVEGQDARDYLRNSILYPADFLVEGFPDVMQKNFAEVMSSTELDAVLDFLMTLRTSGES
jgi:cytochrome c2